MTTARESGKRTGQTYRQLGEHASGQPVAATLVGESFGEGSGMGRRVTGGFSRWSGGRDIGTSNEGEALHVAEPDADAAVGVPA